MKRTMHISSHTIPLNLLPASNTLPPQLLAQLTQGSSCVWYTRLSSPTSESQMTTTHSPVYRHPGDTCAQSPLLTNTAFSQSIRLASNNQGDCSSEKQTCYKLHFPGRFHKLYRPALVCVPSLTHMSISLSQQTNTDWFHSFVTLPSRCSNHVHAH